MDVQARCSSHHVNMRLLWKTLLGVMTAILLVIIAAVLCQVYYALTPVALSPLVKSLDAKRLRWTESLTTGIERMAFAPRRVSTRCCMESACWQRTKNW